MIRGLFGVTMIRGLEVDQGLFGVTMIKRQPSSETEKRWVSSYVMHILEGLFRSIRVYPGPFRFI